MGPKGLNSSCTNSHRTVFNNVQTGAVSQNPDGGETLMAVALLRVEVSGMLEHVPSICTHKVGVQ